MDIQVQVARDVNTDDQHTAQKRFNRMTKQRPFIPWKSDAARFKSSSSWLEARQLAYSNVMALYLCEVKRPTVLCSSDSICASERHECPRKPAISVSQSVSLCSDSARGRAPFCRLRMFRAAGIDLRAMPRNQADRCQT